MYLLGVFKVFCASSKIIVEPKLPRSFLFHITLSFPVLFWELALPSYSGWGRVFPL